MASGGDSVKISHILFKNATHGSELKFGNAADKLHGNLDIKPGTDGGNVESENDPNDSGL